MQLVIFYLITLEKFLSETPPISLQIFPKLSDCCGYNWTHFYSLVDDL